MQEWTLAHPYLTFSLVSLLMILASGTIRDIFGKYPSKQTKEGGPKEENFGSFDSKIQNENSHIN
jgi:hypothetical protein